jgi:hypothetical protein
VRSGLAGGLVTGDATSLGRVLDDWSRTEPTARPSLLAAARGTAPHPDHALAALARSLAVPGLRDRVADHASHRMTLRDTRPPITAARTIEELS